MVDKHFTLRVNNGQPFFILCGAGTPPDPQLLKKKQHGAVNASPRAVKPLKNAYNRRGGVNGCHSFFLRFNKATLRSVQAKRNFTTACPAPAVPPALDELPRAHPRRAAPPLAAEKRKKSPATCRA